MKIITPIAKNILEMYNKQIFNRNEKYRLTIYYQDLKIEDGVLLFNTMTGEIILITEEEYNYIIANEFDKISFHLYWYLVSHWFLIPVEYNEKMMVYLFRNRVYEPSLVSSTANHFVILTTTDCNARCYYCFELGAKRVNMTEKTAEDIAKYIVYKADPSQVVHISWFGGEPLFNPGVIDIISQYLIDNGLRLRSSMTSNGYLFNDEMIKKAKELWNLQSIQITFDGTEDKYNQIKAYIYKDGKSPFKVVLDNIERLLKAKIHISVRLNISEKNYEDLKELIDLFCERFKDCEEKELFKPYLALLYEDIETNLLSHTDEHRKFIYNKLLDIEEYSAGKGLPIYKTGRYGESVICKSCMGDASTTLLISPEGNLGSCEHYVDGDFWGSIYDENPFNRDYDNLRGWREKIPEKEDCKTCFYYPKCSRLRRCASSLNINTKEFCLREYNGSDRYIKMRYDEYLNRLNKKECSCNDKQKLCV